MNRTTRTIRMPSQLSEGIDTLAKQHHRSENEEMVVALEAYLAKEQAMSPVSRPCIIKVGLNPDDHQAISQGLERLHALFNYAEGEQSVEAFNVLCASPKNGLSYQEAFILCQQKFFEVGWVYADAVTK